MTSWRTPTDPEIDKAVGKLTRPELVAYFFRNLKNPRWLTPLEKRGFFKSAPPLQETERGIVSPPWPQADYLVQVAPEMPDEVARIIAGIDTENWGTQLPLVDASLKLPPPIAKRVLPRLSKWMRSQRRHPLLPHRLAQLVVRLAEGGEAQSALSLARTLLEVLPPNVEEPFPLRPRAFVDDDDYRELFDRVAGPLRAAAKEDYTSLLFELLERAVTHVIRANPDAADELGSDVSHWWRPAIEDHVQNATGDVRDVLVEALRDDLLLKIQDSSEAIGAAWQRLLTRPYSIFHRIALYLLVAMDQPPPRLVRNAILERGWFEHPETHHEYFHLLERHFGVLSPEDRSTFLGLVAQAAREAEGKEQAEWWEYRQLWPVRSYLEGLWRSRFDALETKLGALDHPDFMSFFSSESGWIGSSSPKSVEELGQLSLDDLFVFLEEWRPDVVGYGEPTIEGLSHQLMALVSAKAPNFANVAPRFESLAVPYQQALVDGLAAALRDETTFSWAPVLEWASALSSRHAASQESRYLLLRVAALLSVGLNKGASEIPIEMRKETWAIIALLCEHPDPALEPHDGDDDEGMSAANRSLNTVRGEAMHTAIRYGLWVRRGQEGKDNEQTFTQAGFDEMPELRSVLEKHLDVSHDPSIVIRAVYGQWLPWLSLLDPAWTKSHRDRILPPGADQEHLWKAAWETYVTFCPPYTTMLPLLRDQYRLAVAKLAALPRTKPERARDPAARLAEHLASFFWRGEEPLMTEDSLVRSFYNVAPDWLRAHFTEFIGRSLRNAPDGIPEPTQSRLMTLWDWRLEVVSGGLVGDAIEEELDAFMWWASSGKLPADWTANRLLSVSRLISSTGHDMIFAFEQIVKLASTHPSEIAVSLENFVQKDKDLWHTSTWADQIAEAMRRIIATADEEGVAAVRRTAEVLGRRGFLQFREFALI